MKALWAIVALAVDAQVFDMILQPDLEFATSFLRPTGNLAGGVEVVEQNLVAVAEEQNFNARFLDEEADSTLSTVSSSVEATIRFEIADLQRELDFTRDRVDALLSMRDEDSDPCGIYPGCDSCTYDLDCVWCYSSRTCMQGDRTGPYAAFCLHFDYSSCSLVGCTKNSDCVSCLAAPGCGWCTETNLCMAGSEFDSGGCESTLWISGRRAVCPASRSVGSPAKVDAAVTPQPGLVEIDESDILELQIRIQTIETQLLDLNSRLTSLIDGMTTITEASAPGASTVLPRVFYLGDIVDQTAESVGMGYAALQTQQAAEDEGMRTAETLAASTQAAAQESINQRIAAEDAAMGPIRRNMNITATRNTELFDQVMGLIRENEELMLNLSMSVSLEQQQPQVEEDSLVPVETDQQERQSRPTE